MGETEETNCAGNMLAMPVFSQRQTLGPYVLQKPLDSETSRGCIDEETRIQITNI